MYAKLPLKKGDKVRIRKADRAKTYKLQMGKTYTISNTVHNKYRQGQYIELVGKGETRYYAAYFVDAL